MKIRSFIAVNLPKETKEEIKKIIDILGRSRGGIKLVEPENLHFTLHFLGEIGKEKVITVKEILKEAVRDARPYPVKILGLNAFPSRNRPRVIFLEAVSENKSLENLQQKIGQQLKKIGLKIDERPFTLHLTLGRVKNQGLKLPEIKIKENLIFKAISLDLMKSELTPQGPIYTLIESFLF